MKNRRIWYIAFILLMCLGLSVFAQEDDLVTTQQTSNTGLSASSTDASPNIMLARSSTDYRVTPGDVYTLAYSAGSTPISYTITVDTSYRIRVSNLGIINGAGKTFMQLKSEVETIVANNYPLSGVQLVLTQPAVFRVFVKGEVYAAGEVSAWALRRLSSLADGNLTAYASVRDVSVRSSAGQTRTYDLFKAQRLGDLSQDPYLRPGDTVTFNRISRVVTINGAVERPGGYQILPGENLRELITFYANNFTPTADKTRVTLRRYIGGSEISGDVILLTEAEVTGNYPLQHLDTITVPSITASRPSITVSRLERRITIAGAVRRPGDYELMPHENLKELIAVYADGFTPLADKTRVTLRRYVGSSEVSGELLYLSEKEVDSNYVLQHLDVVTIPDITELRPALRVDRVERTITISGAVRQPGTYELMPNENLKELIEIYADGFTAVADKTRATLQRYVGSSEVSGELKYLTETELTGDYALQHLDSITIPDITELRPALRVNRVERTITISGAVRQPGTYELMPNENLKELIEIYADGFTAVADKTRAELIRYVNSTSIAGERISLSEEDFVDDLALQHYDNIYVPSIVQLRPVIFVEGAVSQRVSEALDDLGTVREGELIASTRLVVPFNQGETYASLVRRNVDWFTAVSDTQNAYVVRDAERIPINLNLALYDATYRGEFLVQENDQLIIPFRQYFISVSGAVAAPGRYPYIPDRDWEYYIGLAGGFVPGRNARDSVTIVDTNGKRLKKTDAITPETTITASTNHGLYFWNQYAPVITTVLGLITTVVSIIIASR